MSQFAVEPITVLLAWSAAGISTALTLWMVWRICRRSEAQRPITRLLSAALWAIPIAWAALDAIHLWTEFSTGEPDLHFQFTVLVAASLLGLILAWEPRDFTARALRLIPAFGLAGWLTWQCFAFSHAIRSPLTGRRAEARFIKRMFPQGAIETAPADEQYNCHDYVFYDGPRSKGEITRPQHELDSRGYKQVLKPELNDLIVYKDHTGFILHTGIVRAVGDNGLVIIESKWGGRGRYLHSPDVSGATATYTYWSKTRE